MNKNVLFAQDTLPNNRIGISITNLLISEFSLTYEYVRNKNSTAISASYGINPFLIGNVGGSSILYEQLYQLKIGEKIYLYKTKRGSQFLASVNLSYLRLQYQNKDVKGSQLSTSSNSPIYNQSETHKRLAIDINIHKQKFINKKIMVDYYFGIGVGYKERKIDVNKITTSIPDMSLPATPISYLLTSTVLFPLGGIRLFWMF